MKKIVFYLLFACALLISCKESENMKTELATLEIRNATYFYKDSTICRIHEKEAIDELQALLLRAESDKSNDNFKSFYFLNFAINEQRSVRIEVFGDRFRFKGKRYRAETNIQDMIKEFCK